MKQRRAFTLVEVMVVVSVLGILAALVVPNFSSATNETQVASLSCDLQVMRKQIELYKIHHGETLPALEGETSADFVRRMTSRTDRDGAVGTTFGPYLERIPANPFNRLRTVRVGGAPAGANTDGWRFDPASGVLQADDKVATSGGGVLTHANL